MTATLIAFAAAVLATMLGTILGRNHKALTLARSTAREAGSSLVKGAEAMALSKAKLARQTAESKQQEVESLAKKVAKDASNVTSLTDYLNTRGR